MNLAISLDVPPPTWSGVLDNNDMLPKFKGIEFKALGISLAVNRGDLELSVGGFGVTAMWGAVALLPGLFIRLGGRERHVEWPFRVPRQLASGRKLSAGT